MAKAKSTSTAKPTAAEPAIADGLARPLLFGIAFIGGWTIMMLEILGGRVLAPYFGYSVYQWGGLIGVVMAALAVGYFIGGRIGDRPGAQRFLLSALIISTAFVLVVPRFANDFMPMMRVAGPAWGAVFGTLILLGVPSVLLATISPIVIKLTATDRIANSAGLVYAVSTIGSIGGTFFASFYAIPQLGTRLSHFVAAALLVFAVLAMAYASRRLAAAAVAAVILALGFPFAIDRQPGEIYRAESIHNIIRVFDSPTQRDLYLNYTLGAQTTMSKTGLLTGGYYDTFLIGPHFNGGDKVLFLGVAGGTSLKQLVTAYPKLTVTGVDLDPAVLKVAREYFGLKGERRVTLVAEDARWFVSNAKETYDVIAIDLYVTGHIPFFTTTKEFFALVSKRLSANGIVIMNVLSTTGTGELLNPMIRTVRSVFPSTFLIGHGNYMLIATKRPTSLERMRAVLARQAARAETTQVLARARETLRAASAGRQWPIFTDDLNDVEFRTFRSFFGTR
ncbi:MAG TPA: fused MFS/spermidine synthase [Alphaproteobacteria bacterium]|nr:fused MFS/spermidine synthase [Alphaproteobacteria bacterium]